MKLRENHARSHSAPPRIDYFPGMQRGWLPFAFVGKLKKKKSINTSIGHSTPVDPQLRMESLRRNHPFKPVAAPQNLHAAFEFAPWEQTQVVLRRVAGSMLDAGPLVFLACIYRASCQG